MLDETVTITWHDCFVTGELHGDESIKECVAIAYSGWGCACLDKPPANFGKGMVALYDKLGFSPTEENLNKYYKENFPK